MLSYLENVNNPLVLEYVMMVVVIIHTYKHLLKITKEDILLY